MVSLIVWGIVAVVLIAVLYFIFRRRGGAGYPLAAGGRPPLGAGHFYGAARAVGGGAVATGRFAWQFRASRVVWFVITFGLVLLVDYGYLDSYIGDFFGGLLITALLLIISFVFIFGRGRNVAERLIGWVALLFGLVGLIVPFADFLRVIPFLETLADASFVVLIGPGSGARLIFLFILLVFFFFRGHQRYDIAF